MAKRKRPAAVSEPAPRLPTKKPKADETAEASPHKTSTPRETLQTTTTGETLQIITGSYDRVLHGFTICLGSIEGAAPDFADTFLFNAHASAVRCVAVSPPSAASTSTPSQKVLLASGSTDERIHVYNLSAHPPSRSAPSISALVAPRTIRENARNRELGTLLHHEATVTALCFPTRGKLLSASDDCSVAVTRTRDWAVLSAIRAPRAAAQGRPSGDTAAFGGAPAGVNDVAVHPSLKLMISVSKGERCMRLWNLVTGKKAGVLSFSRDLLHALGEGRYATGEARRVVWGGADEFAVGFDRGIAVFGMDSVPRCRVMGGAGAKIKIHQFAYLALDDEGDGLAVLAVATEDGRIAFYSTRADDLTTEDGNDSGDNNNNNNNDNNNSNSNSNSNKKKTTTQGSLPVAKFVAEVGGSKDGVAGRIKDFVLVRSAASPDRVYVVGGSSDGRVRVWTVSAAELRRRVLGDAREDAEKGIGRMEGTYETHNRITCMAGYLMIARPEGAEDSEEEGGEDAESDDSDGE